MHAKLRWRQFKCVVTSRNRVVGPLRNKPQFATNSRVCVSIHQFPPTVFTPSQISAAPRFFLHPIFALMSLYIRRGVTAFFGLRGAPVLVWLFYFCYSVSNKIASKTITVEPSPPSNNNGAIGIFLGANGSMSIVRVMAACVFADTGVTAASGSGSLNIGI